MMGAYRIRREAIAGEGGTPAEADVTSAVHVHGGGKTTVDLDAVFASGPKDAADGTKAGHHNRPTRVFVVYMKRGYATSFPVVDN